MSDQHEYEGSYSGMVCGAMVLVPDEYGGYGTDCGEQYDHPIHIRGDKK